MSKKPRVYISDRALVEYLEKAHGLPMTRLKADLERILAPRLPDLPSAPCRFDYDGVTFRAKGRTIVTCVRTPK